MGMMVHFEFATAARIIFGPGELGKVGGIAAEMGSRALLVTGADLRRAGRLMGYLADHHVQVDTFQVAGEPSIPVVRQGVEIARGQRVELVISMGGGSALDAGKAIAALATNPGDIHEYVEVIGEGKPLVQTPLPFIAIPTTAGTGSEVTRNAVLGAPEEGIKVSMRSAMMLPRVALVDPELTYSLPPQITASTGMDALTQLLEAFVCVQANPMTDAICRQGMRLAAQSLRVAFIDGQNAPARQDMAIASLFGGLALANAKLGAVHGFAAVLGGLYNAPHGAICARLLPEVMLVNLRALNERQPGNVALEKYLEFARLVTGDAGAAIMDGVKWAQSLCVDFACKGLCSYGVAEADYPEIIRKAQASSSIKGNPLVLSGQELEEILSRGMADY
jgi:alcohol dehydrogenase class IV